MLMVTSPHTKDDGKKEHSGAKKRGKWAWRVANSATMLLPITSQHADQFLLTLSASVNDVL